MLAIRLMQLFSENKADFSKIAAILGVYFQIRDDYINLNSTDVRVLQINLMIKNFKIIITYTN